MLRKKVFTGCTSRPADPSTAGPRTISAVCDVAYAWSLARMRIDGEKVGETPIGNLPVRIGPHEVVFRHPELGEQRHAVTVTMSNPARLSVDMRQK